MARITVIAAGGDQTIHFPSARPALEVPGGRAVELDPGAAGSDDDGDIYIPPILRPTIELPPMYLADALTAVRSRIDALDAGAPAALELLTDGHLDADELVAIQRAAQGHDRDVIVVAKRRHGREAG
jgi:hypothetical protein